MLRRLRRTTLIALLPLLLATAALAAPKWHTLQAPHCLIVSQLSERETRDWASQFEQFTAALRGVIKIDDRFLPPLTVVLFANPGSFAPYRPLGPNGKKREVTGFFASRDTWSVIGLADSFSDEDTRHIVIHEATHWLVSATPSQLPLWLNEGFAEVFSSFEARKDYGLLGQPIPSYVDALRNTTTWVPLQQLMLTGSRDRLYTDNERNRLFYAESWLFVHRLLFLDRAAGFESLNRFFNARLRGADQLTAFVAAFGKDTVAADSDLEHYLRKGGFGLTKLPFPPEAKVGAPFEPATPLAVEIALARLALGSERNEQARLHIARALALDTATAAPYELLALLEYQMKNTPASTAAARQALARGTRDGGMHMLVAQDIWQAQSARGSLDTAAREIADHFARAIELQPKLQIAYTNFACIAPLLPKGTEADALLLISGYKIFPGSADLLVGLAALLHKDKNEAEAQRFLTLALSHPENLTQDQRIQAENMRAEWAIQPRLERIEALVQERNFREALAVCVALLQEPMPMRYHQQLERRRNDLRFTVTLEEAEHAENSTEAIRILDSLDTQPGLSQYQQRLIRESRERHRRNQEQ